MTFRFNDDRDWFFQARFGLFVHWGIYSVDAWHEQDQYLRNRMRRDYERLARRFNPTRFEPDAWLDLAQQAGMRYLCFTTKATLLNTGEPVETRNDLLPHDHVEGKGYLRLYNLPRAVLDRTVPVIRLDY